MGPKTDAGLDDATERDIGIALFNYTWTLLDMDKRTPEQDVEMVHAAHASAHHWMKVGTPVNRTRSEWQCSRVYATLRRPEPALFHARLALAICEENEIGDFDIAFAYEALARAHAIAGESDEAVRWLEQARKACAGVAKDEDRQVVLGDLDTVPVG